LHPSQEDFNLTKRIKEAAKFMDITVIDHLILTDENYYSFADDGQI
jgi:DNA repair protein RadC